MLPALLLLSIAASRAIAGTGDHFVLTRISSLAFARIDPIVNPGQVSGHVHNIMGGSCFSENLNTPEKQAACDCSSVIIGDDKSNYWAPALYYHDANGTFSPILNGNRVYYFTKTPEVKPFPPGLRIISGMAMKRNASDPRSLGVRISCNHGKQKHFLPNGTSHPDGCRSVSMGIFFPSCGLASGDLDSPDHFSHLAWPQAHPGGGAEPFDDPNGLYCPDSHPIKYPTIFMEANYYLNAEQPWHAGNPVILSNGDELGLTYHADFVAGWTGSVLADTIAQCGVGRGVGDQLATCPPLAKSMNESATWYCRLQNRIPNEDVGFYRPLTDLPGCNPVWPSDGPSTRPACEEQNPPEFLYPNTQFVNLKFRERIPMMFTLADNTSDRQEMDQYIPGLGANGASYIRTWGWDASNKDSLKLSTVDEIEASLNDSSTDTTFDPPESSALAAPSSAGDSDHSGATTASGSTSVAAGPSPSVSQVASGGIALALDQHSASTASASVETDTPKAKKPKGKVCKRPRRGLHSEVDDIPAGGRLRPRGRRQTFPLVDQEGPGM